MDERINRIAASANLSAYDARATRNYIDGAPHVKHTATPKILDLGAGEGSVTLPFLELGAQVTAVDTSPNQLAVLQSRCERYRDSLSVRREDISETLHRSEQYDIIVANSFLHHVPDYLGLLGQGIPRLTPWGQFFLFRTHCATIQLECLLGCLATWPTFLGDSSKAMS